MAIGLLEKKGVVHTVHHDLESFFWLVIWLVMRHAQHSDENGPKACAELFQAADEKTALKSKILFLRTNQYVQVINNAPLTYLITRLGDLVYAGQDWGRLAPKPVPLTYEAVLEAFDTALAMTEWPEDDFAKPYRPVISEPLPHAEAHHQEALLQQKKSAKQSAAGSRKTAAAAQTQSHGTQGSKRERPEDPPSAAAEVLRESKRIRSQKENMQAR